MSSKRNGAESRWHGNGSKNIKTLRACVGLGKLQMNALMAYGMIRLFLFCLVALSGLILMAALTAALANVE